MSPVQNSAHPDPPSLPPPRVDSGTIAWRHTITDGPEKAARSFYLHYSKDAKMTITGSSARRVMNHFIMT